LPPSTSPDAEGDHFGIIADRWTEGANMVEVANLQAPLARRSSKPLYAVPLFRIDDPGRARGFLRALLPRIAAGTAADVAGTPQLNVFLSWRAVAAFVAGNPRLDPAAGRSQFELFFTDPTQGPDSLAMADQLGFTGPSAPAKWWAGFRTADIDLAVFVGCDTEEQRQSVLAELRAAAAAAGLSELTVPSFPLGAPSGYLPAGGRLHFGYRDGITTPDVDWEDVGRPGAANLREFVLGYRTDDYPTMPFKEGDWLDFARDGSFACVTWLYQDVAGFEAFLSKHAPALAPSMPGVDAKEWLAARLMGRWRDGTPLALHPDRLPPTPEPPRNDFGYADDPTGQRCPLDAHIRVAFCRDQPFSFANEVRFPQGAPRLIRRGFSYGEPLASARDDGKDRGLFGLFLCARVNEQFYSVLRWMQHTEFSDAFEGGKPGTSGQDRLIGSRLPGGSNRAPDTNVVAAVGGASTTISLQPFIRYKGVVVLFVPSMAALRILAAGGV
jgi:deferrochelatase/peroxidase EfeB